jgi:hypothetical protein
MWPHTHSAGESDGRRPLCCANWGEIQCNARSSIHERQEQPGRHQSYSCLVFFSFLLPGGRVVRAYSYKGRGSTILSCRWEARTASLLCLQAINGKNQLCGPKHTTLETKQQAKHIAVATTSCKSKAHISLFTWVYQTESVSHSVVFFLIINQHQHQQQSQKPSAEQDLICCRLCWVIWCHYWSVWTLGQGPGKWITFLSFGLGREGGIFFLREQGRVVLLGRLSKELVGAVAWSCMLPP